ncbi:MAG: hypothetical protein M3N32_05865 [Actinomycetota bacterium]|nr:hypothetical protein [Actinomycetota bacterium]
MVVDVGLETPEDVAGWRLGMAHLATFVASLSPEMSDRLRHQSIAAVADDPPVTPEILVLVASALSGELPHVVGSPHGTHRWRSG